MSGSFDQHDELRSLLEALCEESISAEQVQRLEELVLGHPEAEATYIQTMAMHADLVGHFGVLPARVERSLRDRVESGQSAASLKRTVSRPLEPSHWSRLLRAAPIGLAGVAAGLLLALTMWQRPFDAPPPPLPHAEPIDRTVAVLLQAPGAEWEDSELTTRVGDPLPPGWLRLKAGFAHIEFYSGATVILEGPAELQLVSRTEAYCARGRLRATVPPEAQGFRVGSPQLNLVDRGTEFGLDVSESGKTEVHVFDGRVELDHLQPGSAESSRHELTTGEGLRFEAADTAVPIELNEAAFRRAEDLVASSEAAIRRHHQQWVEASTAWRHDPSLLVHFSFQSEQSWIRTLVDAAEGNETHDGAIVGCTWGTGRWPGKQALEFKRVSDRVRFHLDGEFDSITLAAWVRPDALPNHFNSLMITDGWEEGEPHWHIDKAGTLELGVQGPKKASNAHYYAPDGVAQERLGQWLHLAVVYDRARGSVTHFVDGRALLEQPIKFEIPLRIGEVELGNWNVATHRNNSPVRYFVGCMDEFMLFSRALREEEIERLYVQGRPPL